VQDTGKNAPHLEKCGILEKLRQIKKKRSTLGKVRYI